MSRRRLISQGRLAAVLALGALSLVACAGPSTGTAATAVATTASASPGSPSGIRGPGVAPGDPVQVTGRVTVGSKPCGVVGGDGRVWVSMFGSGTLRWVDPTTLEPSPPITVGSQPCGLAVGAGSIWVENYGSNTVTRVDAATGKVRSTIPVGSSPYDVTFAAGAAWVTNYGDGTVSRIDAATEKTTVITVSSNPIGIVPAGGTIWVAHENGDLWGIDPATSTVTVRTSIGSAANWTAAEGNDLWVGGRFSDVVVHVNATTGKVIHRYDIGELPLDGDVVDGVAWFPDRAGRLHELPADPATPGRVIDSGVGWPFVIAGLDGKIWAADYTGTDLVRIDPTLS